MVQIDGGILITNTADYQWPSLVIPSYNTLYIRALEAFSARPFEDLTSNPGNDCYSDI